MQIICFFSLSRSLRDLLSNILSDDTRLRRLCTITDPTLMILDNRVESTLCKAKFIRPRYYLPLSRLDELIMTPSKTHYKRGEARNGFTPSHEQNISMKSSSRLIFAHARVALEGILALFIVISTL